MIEPVLDVHNVHTGDRVTGRFYGVTGYDAELVNRLNHLWRDWRQDAVEQIDLRLFWGLAALSQAAKKDGHSGKITFLSGFRTEETNELLRRRGYRTARHSFHLKARAVDFRFEGASVSHIARYAEWLEIGGTGYYGRSSGNFVHVDSGRHRRWNR